MDADPHEEIPSGTAAYLERRSMAERRLLNEGPPPGMPERRSAQRRSATGKIRRKAERRWSHNKLFFYFMVAACLAVMLEFLGDRGLTAMWRNVASTGRPSQSAVHEPSSATSPAVLLHPR